MNSSDVQARPWEGDFVDLRTKFLSDSDAIRLYRAYPELPRSADEGCPTCGGTRQYKWHGWHTCDCEAQLQLHKHYLQAGIGVPMQRLDWVDYVGDLSALHDTQEMLGQHINMMRNGIGAVYRGEFGTGKSMLASLSAKALIRMGYRVYFATFQSMIQMYTSGWTSDADRAEFERRVLFSQVLFLDDVGKEFRTKNNMNESQFDHVLRQRVFSGRSTYLTTNDSEKQMAEGYGAAILSLLNERSVEIKVGGVDFRGTAKKRAVTEAMAGEQRPIF